LTYTILKVLFYFMYKLFIDDVRNPQDVKWVQMPLGPWVIVRNYDQFVKHIMEHGLPSFVSFDHDLGPEHYVTGTPKYGEYKEETGYACARWLVDYCTEYLMHFPEYQVHSMNPIGAENIRGYIENFKKHHRPNFFNEKN